MPIVTSPLPDLVLYARPDCHLCDEARSAIELVLTDRRDRHLTVPRLVEIDIDANDELAGLRDRIPVVEIGSARLELVVSAPRLRRLLEDVLDGSRV